jgi:hypothetical protein
MTYFRDYLNSKGVTCTIRRTRGEDIAAACGQLAGQVRKQQAAKDSKESKPAAKPSRNTKSKK